ncbi:MAG: hypothetical protein M3263_00810 [Thermoproteota archaeon]|nr:hypothetical protein [Thermoproteota archaeon]
MRKCYTNLTEDGDCNNPLIGGIMRDNEHSKQPDVSVETLIDEGID